jgi:hypothetical protein
MKKIASSCGMDINSCAEPAQRIGISKAPCIDSNRLKELGADTDNPKKDIHQRSDCACHESRDIGSYGTCKHQCAYCYADEKIDYQGLLKEALHLAFLRKDEKYVLRVLYSAARKGSEKYNKAPYKDHQAQNALFIEDIQNLIKLSSILHFREDPIYKELWKRYKCDSFQELESYAPR